MYVPNRHVGHIYNLQKRTIFIHVLLNIEKITSFFLVCDLWKGGQIGYFFLGSSIHIYSERGEFPARKLLGTYILTALMCEKIHI